MNLNAEYEGTGYIDPTDWQIKIPVCRIRIEMENAPDGLAWEGVTRWLRAELATICTIICSWVIAPVYEQLADLNIQYRNTLRRTAQEACRTPLPM